MKIDKNIFILLNNFYHKYNVMIKIFIISIIIFSSISLLNRQREFYFNQEVFDLNNIPSGKVVWIYPKDKSKLPIMPDSLVRNLNIQNTHLNYNVDIWIVGILSNNQIIKIEVPDYAIYKFKLGEDL